MKEFTENDMFVNIIKANPKIKIFCYKGVMYYNDTTEEGVVINDLLSGSTS